MVLRTIVIFADQSTRFSPPIVERNGVAIFTATGR